MNGEPILVYLAYKFSNDPTLNTKVARVMAIKIMEKHPNWFVIVPHFTVDAMLDGVVNWDKDFYFSEQRRGQAGLMCIGILSRCNKVVLGCDPTYEHSSGVTWEWMFIRLLNMSYKKDNPIEVLTLKEALGRAQYAKLLNEIKRIEKENGK